MKPMSKFFLIVSGALVLVGVIICIVALIIADSQNYLLFDEEVDGKSVYTVDLTDTDVSKISVNATDADITVYTGQDSEYIEFINFNGSYGSVSTTNTVVSFDEYVNFTSLLSFWDGSFNFKGLRSILDFGTAPEGEKKVNIYLSDERDMKVFSFTLEKGIISFDNISTDTDYTLSVDNGLIKMKNVTTTSKINIKSTKCDISLDNCSFSTFNCDVGDLNLYGNLNVGSEFKVNAKSGSITTEFGTIPENPSVSVKSSGPILIDGAPYTGVFKSTENSEITSEDPSLINVSITGETLGVTLSSLMPTPEETTTAETN